MCDVAETLERSRKPMVPVQFRTRATRSHYSFVRVLEDLT